MTKNFYRIMSGIACFFLIVVALRGWVASKKNAAPASAGVVEQSVAVGTKSNAPRKVTFVVAPVLSDKPSPSESKNK